MVELCRLVVVTFDFRTANPQHEAQKFDCRREMNVRSRCRISGHEIPKVWSEVSGRAAKHVPISPEGFEARWGVAGNEMAMQYRSGEM